MDIAIVDDMATETMLLTKELLEWGESRQINLQIDTFTDGIHFLANFAPQKYELVFMDIYMKEQNGIETARQMRLRDLNCLLIFLTASGEHTWEALKLHSFDYLRKPFSKQQLFQLMDDAAVLVPKAARYLTYGKHQERLYLSEILYLRSDRNYCVLKTRQNEHHYRISYSKVKSDIGEDPRFLECNRGILINMDFIKYIKENTFVMVDGTTFPIRLMDRDLLCEHFMNYRSKKIEEAMQKQKKQEESFL